MGDDEVLQAPLLGISCAAVCRAVPVCAEKQRSGHAEVLLRSVLAGAAGAGHACILRARRPTRCDCLPAQVVRATARVALAQAFPKNHRLIVYRFH